MSRISFSNIPGGFGFQARGLPGAQLGGRTGFSRVIGGGFAAQREGRQSEELHERRLKLLDQLLAGQTGPPGEAGNPFAEGIKKIEQSRRAEIEEGSEDALNNALARLQDRGLGGSSFGLTAELGAEREQQASLNNLAGDIGALEIRGQEAALNLADKERQRQLEFLQKILGSTF